MEKKIIEIVERYAPQLDAAHTDQFNNLINRIDAAFPHYRGQIVQHELDSIEAQENNDVEALRYKVSISVLADLIQQGWFLEVRDGKLFLRLLADETNDKNQVRSRLSSERKAQFQDESVMRFIEKMEKQKPYHNEFISIRNLIGNADTLIQRINVHAEQISVPKQSNTFVQFNYSLESIEKNNQSAEHESIPLYSDNKIMIKKKKKWWSFLPYLLFALVMFFSSAFSFLKDQFYPSNGQGLSSISEALKILFSSSSGIALVSFSVLEALLLKWIDKK